MKSIDVFDEVRVPATATKNLSDQLVAGGLDRVDAGQPIAFVNVTRSMLNRAAKGRDRKYSVFTTPSTFVVVARVKKDDRHQMPLFIVEE